MVPDTDIGQEELVENIYGNIGTTRHTEHGAVFWLQQCRNYTALRRIVMTLQF